MLEFVVQIVVESFQKLFPQITEKFPQITAELYVSGDVWDGGHTGTVMIIQ